MTDLSGATTNDPRENKRVKVLQVIQELEPGGAELIVLSLIGAIEEAGHESAIATASGVWANRVTVPQYRLPLVQRDPRMLPRAVRSLRAAISDFQPDLVHCHNPVMGLICGAVTLGGRRRHALVTVHGVAEADYKRASQMLRMAGVPVVSCGSGVTAALERYGVEVRKTVVNGVAPPPTGSDRFALREGLELDSRRALVLCVGRLVEQKRHDIAIAAAGMLPDVSLVIAGEGPDRHRLTQQAAQLGISNRVRLIGYRPDVRSLMSAADVILMCSDWEGLPLALLEALMSGTPVVASDVRGIRELVADGVQVLLCTPGDPDAFKNGLERVLTNAALASALSSRGKAFGSQFTQEAMTDAYLGLYSEILHGK